MFTWWKLAIAGGVLLFVGLIANHYFSTQKELGKAKETIAVGKVVTEISKDSAAKGEESNAVTDKVSGEVAKAAEGVEKKHNTITARVQKDVAVIKKEFAAKEPSPIILQQETDAISSRRIDALWQSYCQANTEAVPGCE